MVMFISKGTPLAALTGTADKNTLTVVSNKLVLKQPLVLRISPNRKNIRFSVKKNKKEHLLSELDWLTTCIKENGDSTPKTIIFCNTMNEIACYKLFNVETWSESILTPTSKTALQLPRWYIPFYIMGT